MDYDGNDYQSQNLRIGGEESSKLSPVLHTHTRPKFDFDESLQGHLRFDSLVENEVFLGISSQDYNHWIGDFSCGNNTIEFSSSATESCSIPRNNNVWSEATSSESVEMLLKSVGQEEMVRKVTVIEESDAASEFGTTEQMEPIIQQPDKTLNVKEPIPSLPDSSPGNVSVLGENAGVENENAEGGDIHLKETSCTQVSELSANGSSVANRENSNLVDAKSGLQNNLKSGDEIVEGANEMPGDPRSSGDQIHIAECSSQEIIAEKFNARSNDNDRHFEDSHALPMEVGNEAGADSSLNQDSSRNNGELGAPSESQTCCLTPNSQPYVASNVEASVVAAQTSLTDIGECPCLKSDSMTLEGNSEDVCVVDPTQGSSTQSVTSSGGVNINQHSGDDNPIHVVPSLVSHNEYGSEGLGVVITSAETFEISASEISLVQISQGQSSSTGNKEIYNRSGSSFDREDASIDSEASALGGFQGEPSRQVCGASAASVNDLGSLASVSLSARSTGEKSGVESSNGMDDVAEYDKGYSKTRIDISSSVLAASMPEFKEKSATEKVDVGNYDQDIPICDSKDTELAIDVNNTEGKNAESPDQLDVVGSSYMSSDVKENVEKDAGLQFSMHRRNDPVLNNEVAHTNLASGKMADSVTMLSDVGPAVAKNMDNKEQNPVSLDMRSTHLNKEELQHEVHMGLLTSEGSSQVAGKMNSISNEERDAPVNLPATVEFLAPQLEPKESLVERAAVADEGCQELSKKMESTPIHPDDKTATEIGGPNSVEAKTHLGTETEGQVEQGNVHEECMATESQVEQGNGREECRGELPEKIQSAFVYPDTSAEKHQEAEREGIKLSNLEGKGSSKADGNSCHVSVALVACAELSPIEKSKQSGHMEVGVDNVPLSDTGVGKGEILTPVANSGAEGASQMESSFTFDVSPQIVMSVMETGTTCKSFRSFQSSRTSMQFPLASDSSLKLPKDVENLLSASPQAPLKGSPSSGTGGVSERKARRVSGKLGKESSKKGNHIKETTPGKRSERGGKSFGSTNSSRMTQLVNIEVEKSELSVKKPGVDGPIPASSLSDLNSSASALFQPFKQPFTDLQQLQLRAQIFVYGSLIQGAAPDESCMLAAFGSSDDGRIVWEPVWRACVERLRSQKSHPINSGTPMSSGTKTPDLVNKQGARLCSVLPMPTGVSSSRIAASPAASPMIPLSSPLWNISTPIGSGPPANAMAKGSVLDYPALSPFQAFQTPPDRSVVAHATSWLPHSPFPGPWFASAQTSSFEVTARVPALQTETVKLTPVRESSNPNSAARNPATTVPLVQGGGSNALTGSSAVSDSKNVAVLPGPKSVDMKSRKRKKTSVTEDHVQNSLPATPKGLLASPVVSVQLSDKAPVVKDIGMSALVSQSQTEPLIDQRLLTSVSLAINSSMVPTRYPDNHLASLPPIPSSGHSQGAGPSSEKRTLNFVDSRNIEDAKLQAEEAATHAAAAVDQCQGIWNLLHKQKNSNLTSDVEGKLSSSAAAIAAAASVAKAAAAAAKVASDAAVQAKLMADEALGSIAISNLGQSTSSYPISMSNLGSATPASILGVNGNNTPGSIIFAAREASRRRIEAASAASRHAENLDAIVRAAQLAAEAVSLAGKVVAMGDLLPLSELVEAGPDGFWRTSERHISKIKSIEVAPDVLAKQSEDLPGHGRTSENVVRDDIILDEEGVSTSVMQGAMELEGQRISSDFSKPVNVLPESEIGLQLGNRAEETDQNVSSSSKDNAIKEGSFVEVYKLNGNSGGSWFSATVLSLKNGKALVSYSELQTDEGQLKEWVPLDRDGDEAPVIRIPHPMTSVQLEGKRKRRRVAIQDYAWCVGDKVDAWLQDRWCEGVIAERNKKDETTLSIHFPARGETSVVKVWHIRPTLIWKDGEWIELSRSRQEHHPEGDTPNEKRLKLGSAIDSKGKPKLSKDINFVEPDKKEKSNLLPLSANERVFKIGASKDENKTGALRTMRSGLQKEGSKVIFGIPKPGKKQKFMEVSKHYVTEKSTTDNLANYSAKPPKSSLPQGPGSRGWRSNSITNRKENHVAESKPKAHRARRLPNISSRKLDSGKTPSVSAPLDGASTGSGMNHSMSCEENLTGQQSSADCRSHSDTAEAPESPVFHPNASSKASISNPKTERLNKGNLASVGGRSIKVQAKDKQTLEVAEPRRSNRRIQPTSRLLEGLQSQLIVSRLPAVSHDKTHRSHNRGTLK